MKYVTGFIKIVLIIFVVLFCAFNTETQRIILIKGFFEYNVPAFLPAVAGLFAGGALVTLAFASAKIKAGRDNKNLKKQLQDARDEIKRLQNLPLEEKDAKPEDSKEDNQE